MLTVSPRRVAKFAARATVASVAAEATSHAMNLIQDPESDSAEKQNTIGSLAVGTLACVALGRKTDALVDRVADWRTARKEKKQNAAE